MNKSKNLNKRESLIFISFIDLLVVVIFLQISWVSTKLMPIQNFVEVMNVRAFASENTVDKDNFKKGLLENLAALSPEAIRAIAQLNKDQVEQVSELISNLADDKFEKLSTLVGNSKTKGGTSAIPYPEEKLPIATLTIINGDDGDDLSVALMWSNFTPKFEEILKRHNQYPEVVIQTEYKLKEFYEIFLYDIFQKEYNEDKIKLNGLYRHRIEIKVQSVDGSFVSPVRKNMRLSDVYAIKDYFYVRN